MLNYVIRRLLATVPVLIGISFISFALIYLSGDPTDFLLPVNTPEETRRAFRAAQGLDQPFLVQFLDFLAKAITGDFGTSLRFQQSAGSLVWERLGATGELALAAMVIALAIGIPGGTIAAYRYGSVTDRAVRAISLLGQAVPNFYLGVVAVIVCAVWLRILPSGGRGTVEQLILPAFTLGFGLVALIARVTRSCMLDALRQDYIRTARAKGLGENRVVWKHALRNAFIPVLTIIGLQFGLLLNGVVVTEIVLSWPGIGRLAIQSIYARDFPVVQTIVFLSAFTFVMLNLMVDLLYVVLDPRISYK
ncbi:MAG: ABC transporter permease [Alphaproteobacteria bacterium]|nr:ABC transporter permease [Alphaproteobacteria bacterium]